MLNGERIGWRITTLVAILPLAALGLMGLARVAVGEEIHRGGQMTIAPSSGPRSLINQVDTGANSFALAAKYLEPLVNYNPDGSFGARLATSWKVSKDGLTWTFALRKGVKWHDGKPFAAADVKWNMEKVWKRVWSNPALDSVKAVVVPDSHTIVFTMERSVAPDVFLTTLSQRAYVIAPQGFEGKSLRESPQNQKPTGTGPFRVKEYVKGQYILLERNPDYWKKGKPYLDRIVWRIMRDPASRAAALEAGEIDMVPMSAVPHFDIDRLSKHPKLIASTKGYEAYRWGQIIQFNMRRKYTGNKKVRHAIAHAIDKAVIARTAYLNHAKPAVSPIPSTSKFFTSDVPKYSFDPNKAERLLDEAGFRRGPNGMRFSLNLVAPPFLRGVMQRTGQYMRQALKRVGIDVRMEILNMGAYVDRVARKYNFDIQLVTNVFIVDPCMSTTYWYSSAGIKPGMPFRNTSGIKEAELDAAIDNACTEPDPTKRMRYLHDFQRLAKEHLPIYQLVEEEKVNVYNRRLQNVGTHRNWYYHTWDDVWVKE